MQIHAPHDIRSHLSNSTIPSVYFNLEPQNEINVIPSITLVMKTALIQRHTDKHIVTNYETIEFFVRLRISKTGLNAKMFF